MRKLWSMILAGAMCVSLLPAAAFATEEVTEYDLWVGGVQVTSANQSDILGDGTASFVYDTDYETYTLTLDTAVIDRDFESYATFASESGSIAGIYSSLDTLYLELKGENVITMPESTAKTVTESAGIFARELIIYSEYNEELGNSESLTVNGGKVTNSANDAYSYGIAAGNLQIENVTVTAVGGDTESGSGYAESEGIYIFGDELGLYLINSQVVAKGGNAITKAAGYTAYSDGIYLGADVNVDENSSLTVIGGTAEGDEAQSYGIEGYYASADAHGYLTALSGTAKGKTYAASVGVYLDYGNVSSYENANVTIKGGSTTTTAENGEEYTNGVYICGGDVNVIDSTMIVEKGVGETKKDRCPYTILAEAVYEEDDEGSAWWGGTVNVSCSEVVWNGSYRFYGSELTVKGNGGIYGRMGINYDDNLAVTAPKNASVVCIGKELGDEDLAEGEEPGYYTLVDAECAEVTGEIVISPLLYDVHIQNGTAKLKVPALPDKSLNEAYAEALEKSGFEDFSELIKKNKTGYEFKGYFTEDGELFDFDTPITGELTLNAVWEEIVTPAPTVSSYDITVKQPEAGGSVSLSHQRAKEGTEITVTVTPDKGYEVESVTAKTKWSVVSVTENEDGTYRFTQPAGSVTVTVTFAEQEQKQPELTEKREWTASFSDVTEENWYYEAVKFAYVYGLMEGRDEATFDPAGAASREQFVTVLWRLAGSPAVEGTVEFTDVNLAEYYAPAVLWAVENKIVNGYDDGRFGVGDEITREQLAVMLYRYVQSQGGGFTGAWAFRLNFSDIGEISEWAWEAMCWCNMKGIIKGREDGTLDPQGTANRAEMAQILRNHLTLTMN